LIPLSDMVLFMSVLASLLLLLTSPFALPQDQTTYDSCRQDVKEFYNAAPISTLPTKERSGIIRVLLPDLQSQATVGYDPRDLTPERLASLLRYTELAKGRAGQRVAAVTYQPQEPFACGNHGQCPGYLVEIGPRGVKSLVTEEGKGSSVGDTWGAAVISRKGSVYPDLLVLSTISPEVVVACYRWQGNFYTADWDCDVPCAQAFSPPKLPQPSK
jgi:hypothetical protein